MPQIKFSGLVTAMKGKAGGSIFSQNKQGAYFRNNRWGGGRKSARWDAVKVRLATLSNAWRNLSQEQREAWEAASADFPFENKFKEQYIASGYQLFMSLNGNLYANNLPTLTVPGENRPFPDDITFAVDTPDVPWFTGGTGATFPIAGNGLIKPCSQDEDCPFGFTCQNNGCLPNYPIGSPQFLAEREKVREMYYMFGDLDCNDDQDCVDQGLSGGSADVACQNGRCVYVGDSFEAWERTSYVLNIADAIHLQGQWSQAESANDTQVNGSFRFTLGPDSLKKLRTTQNEIVLVSNYSLGAGGPTIRIRPQDQQTTRVYMTFGVATSSTSSELATFVWYQDYPTEMFNGNCVLQFQINPRDTVQNYLCLNASGFSYAQFEYYDGFTNGPVSSWGLPIGTDHNPFLDWIMQGAWTGIVYGAGIYSTPTDVIYSDIRFYTFRYTEFKYALSGMLSGKESILIRANGDARPKCKREQCVDTGDTVYLLNNGQVATDCDWLPGCSCRAGRCGAWKSTERAFSNIAPGGNTDIRMVAAVPISEPIETEPGVYTFSFAGFWLNKLGGSFANNGATFVPLTTAEIGGTTESGFYIVVSVSRAKGNGKTVRTSEFIAMTIFPGEISSNYELWDYIKPTIITAPPGTDFWIAFDIIDTNSGLYRRPVKTIRFKAGADLQSSVN
jgi:hypothetical protein